MKRERERERERCDTVKAVDSNTLVLLSLPLTHRTTEARSLVFCSVFACFRLVDIVSVSQFGSSLSLSLSRSVQRYALNLFKGLLPTFAFTINNSQRQVN